MNPIVHSISDRLSLRAPLRQSLEILDRVCDIAPPSKDADVAEALRGIQAEFPGVTDFERDFPSLCFAIATGVGKTRLMGAIVTYLHLLHDINNFFVLAPNLTIYNKLISDFKLSNTPKYVFKGISEFAIEPPQVITGDNYNQANSIRGAQLPGYQREVRINIFNISKINTEVRGGNVPRIKRLSEYIGESYFDYLAGLDDLVLLMDESHRYRASAGVAAINELKPILGLELTATPFVEKGAKTLPFKNVIYDYPLRRAMEDGFVKEPAVVTRKDFDTKGMLPQEIENIKLQDGMRMHEATKVHLQTYARETEQALVKPFVLIIARDTTHAASLRELIESDKFFEGNYKGRVIQVDSTTKEDVVSERLAKVESADEPTEIIVHVNMLKEGWDVTNLYTIIPLRAANARVLIEQSIGRGLRLPYGKRTGVAAVDRLSIIAHDKFQEIVEEARKSDSPIQLKQLILDTDDIDQPIKNVTSEPEIKIKLGLTDSPSSTPPAFATEREQEIAKDAYKVIEQLKNEPEKVPGAAALRGDAIQKEIVRRVTEQSTPTQPELEGTVKPIDIAKIVAKTIDIVVHGTIDIPRITLHPKEEMPGRFEPFSLDVEKIHYQVPSEALLIQRLREGGQQILEAQGGAVHEDRPEDYIVECLNDFSDICYDTEADLLYDLAKQTVKHLRSYLKREEDVRKVLSYHQRDIAKLIHAQMQEHYVAGEMEYDVKVTSGFVDLKATGYSQSSKYPVMDFRQSPPNKFDIGKYLFNGFSSCLYSETKFDSDSERQLSVILDRDAEKWFRPVGRQFQIFYSFNHNQHLYEPDFVAETETDILMCEVKMRRELEDEEVLAKREAAQMWCAHASEFTARHNGKPWRYLLLPHDKLQENKTLDGLKKVG